MVYTKILHYLFKGENILNWQPYNTINPTHVSLEVSSTGIKRAYSYGKLYMLQS